MFELMKYIAASSAGSWLITALKTASNAMTEVVSLAVGLVAGALTAVSLAVDAFLQWDDDHHFWQIETTIVKDSVEAARAYTNRLLMDKYDDILENTAGVYFVFVDLFVSPLSTTSYVLIFALVCTIVLIVKDYVINALCSTNRVSHRTLSRSRRSRRNNQQNHRQAPQFPQNMHMEQRLPLERGVSDADRDESLLSNIRPRSRVAQPRPQSMPHRGQQLQVPPMHPRPPPPMKTPHAPLASASSSAAHRLGSSGEQNQRRVTPKSISSPPPHSPNLPVPKSTTTAEYLARQLEEERDRQLCVVCQDNVKNIVIMPCKHLCICLECVKEITGQPRRNARKCPLCRQAIRSYLEVYA